MDMTNIRSAEMTMALEAVHHACVGLMPGTRVMAAMSGGVDSSVTAGLLKLAGFDVVGVTMQLYDHGGAAKKKGACCAGQDIYDARQAADKLGIPHYVLDFESKFHDDVIQDFVKTYTAGETPIPCIRCNQTVKFRDLNQLAKELGAAALATGHYVRREQGAKRAELHRAVDDTRDQSYFLFATTPQQLDEVRFPLGGMPKTVVRTLAHELGLEVADKPDSQDICFVPDGNYTNLINKLGVRGTKGPIKHLDGRELGTHEGIGNFTIGQRRGLNIALGEPVFVIDIDADSHTVTVGPREALLTKSLSLKESNWLGDEDSLQAAAEVKKPVLARVRSTREPKPAHLEWRDGAAHVVFADAEEGVAPGQACVLYDTEIESRVLGGGFIADTQALLS